MSHLPMKLLCKKIEKRNLKLQQWNLKLQGASNLTLSEIQNGDVSEETLGAGKVKKSKHSMNMGLLEAQNGDLSHEAGENIKVKNIPRNLSLPIHNQKRKMLNDAGPDTKKTPKDTENNVEVPSLLLKVTGAFEDISFASLCHLVNENTLKAIKEMGFTNMTEIQDLLAAAKTGSGKTLAFLTPAVEHIVTLKFMPRKGRGVLILSPSRELAMQTFGVLKELITQHVHTYGLIMGDGNRSAEAQKLANRINIIVATPGCLLDHMQNTPGFMYKNLQCLVIDKADQILDIGFEVKLKQTIKLLPTCRWIMLFSATQIRTVEDLQGYVVHPSEKRFLLFFTFLEKNRKKVLMVFLSSCMSVKYHCKLPNYIDLPVLAIHGKQKQNKHTTTFFQFCNADSGTLLCTDVAARGLDIPEVDWIIQYDPPDDPKEYRHRVGRTARGLNGRGHALLIFEFDCSWSKISNTQPQLEKLIEKNYFLDKSAQEACKSYIQAYDSHSLKQIFNVNNLNLPQVALSFGFKVAPFVDLNINSNEGKKKKRGGSGGFGYKKTKKVEKSKIFKHFSKKSSDSRQFSH
uniref:ATP-dependent RNA helicase n=1 Tax=Aotus nancymaae TaxID=37293 RepID=A0A2K5DAB5_AOTNA